MFYKNNNVSTGVCLLFTAILTATTIQFNIQKEELEEEKNKLTNDIEDLREENVKLTNELENKNKELDKVFKKMEKVKTKNEELTKEIKRKDKQLKKKDEEIKKLKKPTTLIDSSSVEGNNTITMVATYYTAQCTGCTGRTASGYKLAEGQTTVDGYRIVAADTNILPLHSKIKITNPDGSSYKAIVMDRGGAIKGNKLDVLTTTKNEAYRNGKHDVKVEVLSYGDNKYRKVN